MGSLYALLQHIHTTYPEIKTVTLQSDCAPAFHGYGHIVYLNRLNQVLGQLDKLFIVDKWFSTEAGYGKSRLDAHFTFVNVQLRNALDANK